jgi:hypothetical protein
MSILLFVVWLLCDAVSVCAMAQAVSCWTVTIKFQFQSQGSHVGFMVDEVELS